MASEIRAQAAYVDHRSETNRWGRRPRRPERRRRWPGRLVAALVDEHVHGHGHEEQAQVGDGPMEDLHGHGRRPGHQQPGAEPDKAGAGQQAATAQ